MSLAFGRDHLAIPGPSVIPARVLRAMHQAAPNIYTGDLLDLAESIYADLASIARSSQEPVIYIGNGHAAWEASLVNVLAPGDRALCLVNGRFGLAWATMAEALGANIELLDFGSNEPVDPLRVASALAQDSRHEFKAVLSVLSDTSTSTHNDIAGIRKAIDQHAHPALLMVDAICSFGCEPFDMDGWGVDVMVAGCQKGLMTPPGLAFTFASARALEVRRALERVSPYWDWLPRVEPRMFPERFCGTPPTHHLFGLREAVDMLLEEGMEHVWTRHRTLASAVWASVDAWSDGGDIACHVPDPAHRSHAVTAVRTADGDATRLRAWCEREAGVTLGVALSARPTPAGEAAPDCQFRIGHMGHLNPPMLLGTLGVIDAGLKALDIPHGSGAVEAATAVLASAATTHTS